MRIDRFKLMHTMIDKNINVCVLAERAGLSRATVSGIRNGRSCLYETVMKIAEALGVKPEDLLEK